MKSNSLPLLTLCLVLTASQVQAMSLISDDFEVDSSASYTIVDESNATSGDGTPDSTSAFAFDYVSAGIPLAPNSMAGDRGGLRLAVNETANDAGAADHIAAFHNTALSGEFVLQVDVYMAVQAGAGGSTEMAHIGVGGSTSDFLSIFTPIVDNGYFIEFTGEGGSSSDFRMSAPGEPAIPDGDPRYLNSTNTTNATGDVYQALYPATDFPGSPGNSWTTLKISVTDTTVFYNLDGVDVMATPNTGLPGDFMSLGYTDPFSSVGPHFVVYDNLQVRQIPEPSTMAGIVISLFGLAGFRRR